MQFLGPESESGVLNFQILELEPESTKNKDSTSVVCACVCGFMPEISIYEIYSVLPVSRSAELLLVECAVILIICYTKSVFCYCYYYIIVCDK